MSTTSWRRAVTTTAGALLVAAVAAAAIILVLIPRATHGVALSVLTGSMEPSIPTGSVVIDRPVDPGTLHVGDVATYQVAPGKAAFITHRIVAVNTKTSPTTFIFKGDANRGPDLTPVPATAIRGRVWFHVPYLGAIRDSLQSRGTRSTALVLAIAALAGYALWQCLGALRERRRPPGTQPPALAANDVDVTVLATISLTALNTLSGEGTRMLLRAVIVDEGRNDCLVSVPVLAEAVDDALLLLREQLGARIVQVVPVESSSRLERLRSRTPDLCNA